MASTEVRNNPENVTKQAVDLLSENDCILLRQSRKTSWYKPHSRNKYVEDENILIDSGRRSRDRKKNKIEPKTVSKQKPQTEKRLPPNTPPCKDRKRCSEMTRKKDYAINVSVNAMAHMIKLAFSQKCDTMLQYLLEQLRGLKEEIINNVMDKLSFEERMIVVKSRYFNRYDKPPWPRKKRIVSPVQSSSCQRQSSSLSRIDKSQRRKVNPIRKSFSFLMADLVDNPFKSGCNTISTSNQPAPEFAPKSANATETVKDQCAEEAKATKEYKMSKALLQQINYLQHQNVDLKNRIRELIVNNYVLEQKLTSSHRKMCANEEAQSQIVTITRCHDDIIDNVYEAYAQLTKNLKNLKFNRKLSMSTTDLSRKKNDLPKFPRNPRSTSSDAAIRMKNQTMIDKQCPLSMSHSRDSVTSLSDFLTNRKFSLITEIRTTDLEVNKINNQLKDDATKSPIYEKHVKEKAFLEHHLHTLQVMLKSIDDECNNY